MKISCPSCGNTVKTYRPKGKPGSVYRVGKHILLDKHEQCPGSLRTMDASEAMRREVTSREEKKRERPRCPGCGRFTVTEWKGSTLTNFRYRYCYKCGREESEEMRKTISS